MPFLFCLFKFDFLYWLQLENVESGFCFPEFIAGHIMAKSKQT